MFTGLIEATGSVVAVRADGPEMDLTVDLGGLARGAAVGQSIALSGVCCTVTRLEGAVGHFRLTAETLARSWLSAAARGCRLNLEGSLRAGDPLGGHLVQGHIDGLAEVVTSIDPTAGGALVVRLPEQLLRYCAMKGSVALDGVSLTVAGLAGDEVTAAIIPHTAQVTTLGEAVVGQKINVEVDVLAKYVERMLGVAVAATGSGSVVASLEARDRLVT